ncbi:MAG: AraC family transcriptional regulator [Oscillospiraceae bacterium]|nr:AraC family transcriptional regulator [Oscillospiraceae bacterium]
MAASHMDTRTGKYRYLETDLCRSMPFYIQMAGFDRCAPQYRVERERSPISVIGLTLSGSGTVCQNGQQVRAVPGSLFLVTAGDSHVYYPEADWEFCWVNLAGSHWQELVRLYGLQDKILFSPFALGGEFLALIARITEEETDPDSWQTEMQTFLFRTLLHLHQTQQREAPPLAARVRSEFERCAESGLTQTEVCRRIGITPRHAQRIFRQTYGESIHRYLAQKKLQKAQALLIGTDRSVAQIAEETGFENEKYFSTFFRQQTGLTPTQYRRGRTG